MFNVPSSILFHDPALHYTNIWLWRMNCKFIFACGYAFVSFICWEPLLTGRRERGHSKDGKARRESSNTNGASMRPQPVCPLSSVHFLAHLRTLGFIMVAALDIINRQRIQQFGLVVSGELPYILLGEAGYCEGWRVAFLVYGPLWFDFISMVLDQSAPCFFLLRWEPSSSTP